MMKQLGSFLLALVLLVNVAACSEAQPTWQEQYDLGVRYLSEGNYEEAILSFNAAIEIDPKIADAYFKLSETYMAMENSAQSAESMLRGWKNCREEDRPRFLEALTQLGYEIDENGNLKEIVSDQILEEILQTAENVLYPHHTYALQYLSYDQMRTAYEPLIPLLEQYIWARPQDENGYLYLSQLYCRLNEMNLCLAVRTEGYTQTGYESLIPEEHTLITSADTQVLDAWGRTIVSESENDGTKSENQYGEGEQFTRWVTSGTSGQDDSIMHEYTYENGHVISSTTQSSDGLFNDTATYEYPEDGVCIITTISPNVLAPNNITKEIVHFGELGELFKIEGYDSNGNLIYSNEYD